jgi:glycosyltransferase involved in cell wall biosynthesis
VRPLRLVITTRRFWPAVGGTERFIANLAAGLVARGALVTVLTIQWDPSWPAEITYRGAAVVRLPRPEEGFFGSHRAMRNLARWLRRHDGLYDLVYVCGLRDDAFAALGAAGGRVPVVLRATSSGPLGDCLWQLNSGFGRRVKRRALKAAALVGPTETSYRELVAAGYPRDRAYALPSGVPLPGLADPAARQAAREALESVNPLLHCPPGAPVAVYTGRLDDPQSPGVAVAAWRQVAQRWRAARLWLIGPHANQPELNRRIEAADLVGRAVIPGAFADVEEVLAAADGVIVPDGDSDAPLLLLEAMASRAAVVAIDSPDNRSLAGSGRFARLVPPGDPQPLGDALVELFDSACDAARLGAAAREHVGREYGIDRAVEEHLALFSSLTQQKRSLDRS